MDDDEGTTVVSLSFANKSTTSISPILMDSALLRDGTPARLKQLQEDDPSIKFSLNAKETGQQPSQDAIKSKGPDIRKLIQMWDQLVISNVNSNVDSKTMTGRGSSISAQCS